MSPAVASMVTLFVLIGTIAFGFVKKLNIGILSFGIAMVLGALIGMTQKQVVAGFNTSLFIILLGSMLLFSIAQINGSIDLLAQKIVMLSGKQGWAVPLFMYLLGFIIAIAGPGTIPGFAIVAMFGVPLAFAMKANPFLFCSIGQMGAIAGGIVPWAPTGVVGLAKAAEAGYTSGVAMPLFVNCVISTLFVSIAIYVLYRGWRVTGATHLNKSDVPSFSRMQLLTLTGIVAMVASVIIFKTNIGLTSFLIASILIICGAADMSQAVKAIPYNTIFLVLGISVLMNVVIEGGGIHLLADTLASVMTEYTAPSLIAAASGCMSWFSSTSGVVMPTMIPTIPGIISNLGAVAIPPALMVSAVTMGSSVAGISPASTGGAFIMTAIAENDEGRKLDKNKLFIQLFLTSMFSVVMVVLFVLLGGFSFTPYN